LKVSYKLAGGINLLIETTTTPRASRVELSEKINVS